MNIKLKPVHSDTDGQQPLRLSVPLPSASQLQAAIAASTTAQAAPATVSSSAAENGASAGLPPELDIDSEGVFNGMCPHCWQKFRMADVLYISRHSSLIGDEVAGADAPRRFLPQRFNAQGYPVDDGGMVCTEMACPHCHLPLLDALVDHDSSIFSIVGAPASGKSYFLTSMVWQLRQVLPRNFSYVFNDASEQFNMTLKTYENMLFMNPNPQDYVALPKTELQGKSFSDQILLNGMRMDLPLPFVFTLEAMPGSSRYHGHGRSLRNLVFYDNAGEHFEPGADVSTSMATQHLTHSDGIIFLFDPLRDAHFRQKCNRADPQVSAMIQSTNQLTLFNEMTSRIRRYSGIGPEAPLDIPLVVAVPKYDAWADCFPYELRDIPYCRYDDETRQYYLDMGVVTNISYVMRDILKNETQLVSVCESCFRTVYYIPVSALGHIPELVPGKGIAIRPAELNPAWSEVPMLVHLYYEKLLDCVWSKCAHAPLELTDYEMVDGALLYSIPGVPGRDVLPENYWGQVVYSMSLGDYVRLPKPDKTEDRAAQSSKVAEGIDRAFWEN